MLTCSTDVWVRRGAVTLSVFAVAACGEAPTGPDGDRPQFSQSQTGNGAPSGWHFNLNIIGVEKGHENAISPNAQGHVIFVPLTGPCDIKLTMGDYQVTDWSCLDGDRDAGFQLPDPDPGDNGGLLAYSVWVRARGKPTGSATMTTCFFEFSSATTWCNAGELVVRINRIDAGKFVDVSKELLQVCADVDPTASEDLELVPLFSPLGTDYFWHYENTGLRLAQLRLYPIATTAIGGDCTRTTYPSHWRRTMPAREGRIPCRGVRPPVLEFTRRTFLGQEAFGADHGGELRAQHSDRDPPIVPSRWCVRSQHGAPGASPCCRVARAVDSTDDADHVLPELRRAAGRR